MSVAYIALGSNLGDRAAHLQSAVQVLDGTRGVSVVRVSTFHETEPVGGPPDQLQYLNAAAELQTTLSPEALLNVLLAVERQLGRVRAERDAPRTLDLDLLLYDDLIRMAPAPIVPHPRMHERKFVLAPLTEIAPGAVHPIIGTSVQELLKRLNMPAKGSADILLTGLRCVVTGSTGGIGRAIALALAKNGADVIVHGRRSPAAAEQVAAAVASHKVRSQALTADLRDPALCDQLVESAWELWGGIDVWFNVAGADILTGEASQWHFERKLAELISVDVAATMRLGRAVGERMKDRGGSIINMGWDQAETGMEGDSGQLFGAVKGAVMAFTRSLAVSLAPAVRVNCLAPGWIRTAWGEAASAQWQDRVRRETPLGRWGTPDDVAAAACWLASPAAAFITGQVIRINGGAVR